MRSVAFGGLAAGQDDHPPVDPPDVTALAAVVLEVAIVGAYIAEYSRVGKVEDGWQERLFNLFWPLVRA
jgi:hypothetical protein